MKQLFTAIITLIVLTANAQVNRILQQLHDPKDKHILVAAHRGDWRNAPENSLQAFSNAIAMGVDIIEVDLDTSKDGVVVIMHDNSINRTTTGKGKTADYTLAQLKTFHLRDGLGAPTAHTIPTLTEVMQLAKGKVLVNLDHATPFFRQAHAVLQQTRTLQQAIFKSGASYEQLFARYGHLLDSIAFMPVVETGEDTGQAFIEGYQQHGQPVACELVFDKDSVALLRDHGCIRSRVWVNSLWPWLCGGHNDDRAVDQGDTAGSWGWLVEHGVGIIQTDRPQALLAYLRKNKFHQ